jgi:hypothetical protein
MPNAPEYDAWYRALDLEPGAAPEQIDENWKLLVNAWHPDKFAGGLRDKATARLQQINAARDELNRYWRDFGTPPPTSPFNNFRNGGRPSPDWERAAKAAAAASRRSAPAAPEPPARQRRRTVIKLMKWLLLFILVWVTWQPILWNKEAAVIGLFFWLLMLFGVAQLFEGIANNLLGALTPRQR